MTLNEVVWRQACAIKTKSDEFLHVLKKKPDSQEISMEIATQTAIVLCYTSYASGDISPMQIYDDIITQVSQLQTAVWQYNKTCTDSTLQDLGRKLYESCATLKKRLRKKLAALETLESLAEEATNAIQDTFGVTQPQRGVATCI